MHEMIAYICKNKRTYHLCPIVCVGGEAPKGHDIRHKLRRKKTIPYIAVLAVYSMKG